MGLATVPRMLWLTTLAGAFALAATACGGATSTIGDAGLAQSDVPDGWLAADIDASEGQPLWDTLPDLLAVTSDAHLLLRAFQSESGLHGAATMFIEAEDAAALPPNYESQRVLEPLTRLLVRQDALLIPDPLGGDPGTYVRTTDQPLPGSLRSLLVRIVDDNTLYSESLTFVVGHVLAVVTVWYPEGEDPFATVDDLAIIVEARLEALVES